MPSGPSLASRIATAATACWPARVSTPARASRRTRGAAPTGNRSGGPQAQPEPAHRHEQAQAQHDHAERRPHAEHELGRAWTGSSMSRLPPMPANTQVGRGHEEAGQQRGQRRAGEPSVRLQHAREHDADAVEHDLRGEDEQEPRREVDLGAVAAAEQQPGDRLGGQRDDRRQRRQDQQRPAEQRRCGAAHLLAVPGRDAPGEHGDDEAGQRAARHDLEDDVRDGVGGQVGVTGAVGADGVGEDQRPAEAGEPGEER